MSLTQLLPKLLSFELECPASVISICDRQLCILLVMCWVIRSWRQCGKCLGACTLVVEKVFGVGQHARVYSTNEKSQSQSPCKQEANAGIEQQQQHKCAYHSHLARQREKGVEKHRQSEGQADIFVISFDAAPNFINSKQTAKIICAT